MKLKDKVKQIKQWYVEVKIQRLGHDSDCYSVPSAAFIFGISPRLINKVLQKVENNVRR